ncbi:MAG TPA: helicase-related protein [Opitutus sp.]|nr:helicase-related protein [Opitutus sp.]
MHARGYMTDRLHGDISQAQRDRVMDKFRRRGFEFLVATDVAARGLDVDDLEVVFNFDLPNDSEDYTHRIGRTGRAGKSGRAFTFVSGQEIYKLQSMVRWAKLNVRRGTIPSLDEVEEARTSVFFEKIRATLDAKQFKPHDRMIDRLLDQGYASTDICSALIHLLRGAPGLSEKKTSSAAATPKPSAAPALAVTTAPAPRAVKAAPDWAKPVAAGKTKEHRAETKPKKIAIKEAEIQPEIAAHAAGDEETQTTRKSKYERPARTGREPGMTTIFLNVGRKQLVTPADIVGKVSGVTRLTANVVGAIDIHQRHTLADVAEDQVQFIVSKLKGIKLKGVALEPSVATGKEKELED